MSDTAFTTPGAAEREVAGPMPALSRPLLALVVVVVLGLGLLAWRCFPSRESYRAANAPSRSSPGSQTTEARLAPGEAAQAFSRQVMATTAATGAAVLLTLLVGLVVWQCAWRHRAQAAEVYWRSQVLRLKYQVTEDQKLKEIMQETEAQLRTELRELDQDRTRLQAELDQRQCREHDRSHPQGATLTELSSTQPMPAGLDRQLPAGPLDCNEGKYRAVLENIQEVVFELDSFGHWLFLNPAWTALTGFAVQPTLGAFFLEYLPSEEREHNRLVFLKLLERQLEYCRYETRLVTRNGQSRWVEVYAQPLPAQDGQVPGIAGTLLDITERKHAELQTQKLAAFPKLSPNPVLEFAADGTLTYANEAALALVHALGQAELPAILPPKAGELARHCLASGQKQLRQEVQLERRILSWSFFPIAAHQVVHCYGADVTEIQNLEAQLRQAQKLESVGQLAAGVAHDFNNLLTIIQGYTECLLVSHAENGSLTGPLKQITLASKRASALTRQLLTFSRRQLIQRRPLDLNSVLQELVRTLGRLLGPEVVLDHSYEPNLPAIEADAGMMEQVVLNLAVNARDAMPQGGRLRLATRRVAVGADYVQRHAEARPGAFVCLAVSDTGCGMDAPTRERLFEPFFTTKEVGKGTGLGLATVYGIVKQHQGWIEVTTAPGQGTCFEIYLPTLAAAAPTAPSTLSAPGARSGGETILLVEDDAVLREMVREVLQRHDYHVIEAGSGVEALRLWDEQGEAVDLLLTDMMMPEGMSGRDLAEQLQRRKPGLKIIYSSGYSAEILGGDFALQGVTFLPKPYNPTQLAHLVRQCLEAAPATPRSACVVQA